MPALDVARQLEFSSRLQGVSSFEALLDVVCAEVLEAVGYRAVWVAILEPDGESIRILVQRGGNPWDQAQVIPVAGDVHLQRLIASRAPVVVEDAQTDPDVNREIVLALGNRTIVNVPMNFIDVPFGALGMGTFGDEGVRLPTDEELVYLQQLSNQIVIASSRLILLQERERSAAERARLERLMTQRQRLESLGQLAGGVAHDFNNLLTVILGAAALLTSDEQDPERLAELHLIEDAAKRAAQLTARLLALGKRQSLRVQPTDTNGALRDILVLVRRVVPATIGIELREGPNLPLVVADSAQLEQVFMNLCLNARDAMPRGGKLTLESSNVELDRDFVTAHPWAKAGRYVRVTVQDSGTGMPPDVLERIFEPFYTTKADKGSGLGLAVSRGIVEQHGGLIHAESSPGAGTTFRIYLPVNAYVAAAAELAPAE